MVPVVNLYEFGHNNDSRRRIQRLKDPTQGMCDAGKLSWRAATEVLGSLAAPEFKLISYRCSYTL